MYRLYFLFGKKKVVVDESRKLSRATMMLRSGRKKKALPASPKADDVADSLSALAVGDTNVVANAGPDTGAGAKKKTRSRAKKKLFGGATDGKKNAVPAAADEDQENQANASTAALANVVSTPTPAKPTKLSINAASSSSSSSPIDEELEEKALQWFISAGDTPRTGGKASATTATTLTTATNDKSSAASTVAAAAERVQAILFSHWPAVAELPVLVGPPCVQVSLIVDGARVGQRCGNTDDKLFA